MTALPWKEDYRINVAVIDEQHRKLAELVSGFYELLASKPDVRQLKHILDELIGFARLHFATEEELMIKYEYPDYGSHSAAHRNVLNQLGALAERLEDGLRTHSRPAPSISDDWVTNHLLEKDKPLGRFLNGKGVF